MANRYTSRSRTARSQEDLRRQQLQTQRSSDQQEADLKLQIGMTAGKALLNKRAANIAESEAYLGIKSKDDSVVAEGTNLYTSTKKPKSANLYQNITGKYYEQNPEVLKQIRGQASKDNTVTDQITSLYGSTAADEYSKKWKEDHPIIDSSGRTDILGLDQRYDESGNINQIGEIQQGIGVRYRQGIGKGNDFTHWSPKLNFDLNVQGDTITDKDRAETLRIQEDQLFGDNPIYGDKEALPVGTNEPIQEELYGGVEPIYDDPPLHKPEFTDDQLTGINERAKEALIKRATERENQQKLPSKDMLDKSSQEIKELTTDMDPSQMVETISDEEYSAMENARLQDLEIQELEENLKNNPVTATDEQILKRKEDAIQRDLKVTKDIDDENILPDVKFDDNEGIDDIPDDETIASWLNDPLSKDDGNQYASSGSFVDGIPSDMFYNKSDESSDTSVLKTTEQVINQQAENSVDNAINNITKNTRMNQLKNVKSMAGDIQAIAGESDKETKMRAATNIGSKAGSKVAVKQIEKQAGKKIAQEAADALASKAGSDVTKVVGKVAAKEAAKASAKALAGSAVGAVTGPLDIIQGGEEAGKATSDFGAMAGRAKQASGIATAGGAVLTGLGVLANIVPFVGQAASAAMISAGTAIMKGGSIASAVSSGGQIAGSIGEGMRGKTAFDSYEGPRSGRSRVKKFRT